MFFDTTINTRAERAALRQLQQNWSWYFFLGIGLVAFGSLAVMFSFASTLFSMLYLGFFLIIIGIFEGFQSFKLSEWGSFFLHLLISILYVIGGTFIVMKPTLNALTLTLLLAIFLVITGIVRIIFALTMTIPHKGLLLLNGILTLILGILIWSEWPFSGLWVIGTFVGIDAIFTGWTWILLALKAKNLKKIE